MAACKREEDGNEDSSGSPRRIGGKGGVVQVVADSGLEPGSFGAAADVVFVGKETGADGDRADELGGIRMRDRGLWHE
jgi:hypothetical protein